VVAAKKKVIHKGIFALMSGLECFLVGPERFAADP
jgi:hypothetical protein